MNQGKYCVAQICINGHTINAYSDRDPEHNEKFCHKCGARTITTCQQCNIPIRGKFLTPGVAVVISYIPPKFCYECGQAYPWTESKVEAAEALCDQIPTFSEEERAELKECIRNIIRDTPQTIIAAVKFRDFMAGAGPVMKVALWDTIADIADSKAKNLINQ